MKELLLTLAFGCLSVAPAFGTVLTFSLADSLVISSALPRRESIPIAC